MDGMVSRTHVISLSVQKALNIKNFENVRTQISLPPGVYPAELATSENGIRWVLVSRNGMRYGWSVRALPPLLEDDLLRIYRDGSEIQSVSEL
jgi:hypothetical protein